MASNKLYTDSDGQLANSLINWRHNPLTSVQRNALGLTLTSANVAVFVYDTDLLQGFYWTGSTWAASGGSGGAVWGMITGSLSAQTDLQNALNLKANIAALAPVAFSGSYSSLTGQPTLLSQFTNDPGFITASSTNTLTNKSGNISQWTNNVGYLTSIAGLAGGADTNIQYNSSGNFAGSANFIWDNTNHIATVITAPTDSTVFNSFIATNNGTSGSNIQFHGGAFVSQGTQKGSSGSRQETAWRWYNKNFGGATGSWDAVFEYQNNNGSWTQAMLMDNTGSMVIANQVGALNLTVNGGTTTRAPIRIGTGSSTLLASPANGSIEADNNHLYWTAGGVRFQLDQQSAGASTLQAVTTAGNTTTNSIILNGPTGTTTLAYNQLSFSLTNPTIVYTPIVLKPIAPGEPSQVDWNITRIYSAQTGQPGNEIVNMGFNLNPANQRINSASEAMGWSMESNYRPSSVRFWEWHQIYLPQNNNQIRLSSYTLNTGNSPATDNPDIDFYHTVNRFYLRNPANNAVQFQIGDLGSGSIGMSIANTTWSVLWNMNASGLQINDTGGTGAGRQFEVDGFFSGSLGGQLFWVAGAQSGVITGGRGSQPFNIKGAGNAYFYNIGPGTVTLTDALNGAWSAEMVLETTSSTHFSFFVAQNDVGGVLEFGKYGSATGSYGAVPNGGALIYTADALPLVIMTDNGAGHILFATGGNTQKADLKATGQWQFNPYGSGTFTGTPTKLAAFDASGNIIEVSVAISSLLTGYTSGPGVITSTDTILQAIQKLNGNIQAIGPGVAGSPGADGQDGQDGVSIVGPQGPSGPSGPQGLQGIQGIRGDDGADGSDGISIVGPTGPTGLQGPIGPQGLQGIEGPQGEQGDQGDPGPQGPAGAAGSNGSTGPTGPQGNNGIPGADGSDGDDGVSIVGPTGPTGPQGPAGSGLTTGQAMQIANGNYTV